MSNYNSSCVYYDCEHEQGFDVITCNLHGRYGYCPCDNCEHYFDKYEDFEVVAHCTRFCIEVDQGIYLYKCSHCGEEVKLPFEYCPFCGSKVVNFSYIRKNEVNSHE